MSTQPRYPKPARGFSLVELLIAVTLGLLLLVSVGSVFLGSGQSFRTQESLSQIQESGRFVNYLFLPYIRQAGYLPDPRDQTDPQAIFSDVNGSGAEGGNLLAIWGEAGPDDDDPDRIVTRYAGTDPVNGQIFSCQGQAVPDGQIVENVFAVNANRELTCGTRFFNSLTGGSEPGGSNPQPLISGVSNLKILYGVDNNDADDVAVGGLTPNRFVTATELEDDGLDWRRVVAVRLDITAAGAAQTESSGDSFTVDDVPFIEDRRLQRPFSSVVLIRNRLRE